MDKYNDVLLFKMAIAISVIFLCVILIGTNDIKIKFPKTRAVKPAPAKEEVAVNDYSEIVEESQDLSPISQGQLKIALPDGVKKENVIINKKLINRRIDISFPKGVHEYDFSGIENNSMVITGINHSIENDIVNIKIEFASVIDCVADYNDGRLIMELFRPADVDVPVVVIDAGHGGEDVGAIEDGIYEKNIDLQVCLLLKQMLDKEDILVYYTRLDDSYPSVIERADFANEVMPDLFISVHSNWFTSSGICGTGVLYNDKDVSEHGSLWLSNILLSNIVSNCGMSDRGAVSGNDIHIVRSSNVPVALVELGFMSNPNDFEVLRSEKGQLKLAQSIYSGIIQSLTELGKY